MAWEAQNPRRARHSHRVRVTDLIAQWLLEYKLETHCDSNLTLPLQQPH